jgi:hypothetical protein
MSFARRSSKWVVRVWSTGKPGAGGPLVLINRVVRMLVEASGAALLTALIVASQF